MSLTVVSKAEIIKEYQRSPTDTGSSEAQVALLTGRITYLTEHLKTHKKDKHSRRGLLNLVSGRRKLLDYVKRTKPQTYKMLLEKLGLRR